MSHRITSWFAEHGALRREATKSSATESEISSLTESTPDDPTTQPVDVRPPQKARRPPHHPTGFLRRHAAPTAPSRRVRFSGPVIPERFTARTPSARGPPHLTELKPRTASTNPITAPSRSQRALAPPDEDRTAGLSASADRDAHIPRSTVRARESRGPGTVGPAWRQPVTFFGIWSTSPLAPRVPEAR